MSISPDPSFHRELELQAVRHVEQLLDDARLQVDTADGHRSVKPLLRNVVRNNRAVDLKRRMSELSVPDRDLESRMPTGEDLEVTLSRKRWGIFKKPMGRIKVLCHSPVKALLKGEAVAPMTAGQVTKLLSEVPPPLKGIPTTLALVSTAGFTQEARELVDRRADRTLLLLEPDERGGWRVTATSEMTFTAELFNPELDPAKRKRVREAIEEMRPEWQESGLTSDRLVARTGLPVQLVEEELRSYGKSAGGLVVKRLEGRIVLYREGTMPEVVMDMGGSQMPLLDRLKSLFSRQGATGKKIGYLSERRAALSLQREKLYEDIDAFEKRESALKRQFREATAAITKKRVTSQLLQLRKDADRRQQMLGVLNQQLEVVNTHLHNLELVQQGKQANLPSADELAADSVAAEDMLAQLQADADAAEAVMSAPLSRMSTEEQELFDELERESRTTEFGSAQARQPASQEPAGTTEPIDDTDDDREPRQRSRPEPG